MIIIPAIDIKEGCVVRLFQGNFSDQKIYSRDPVKVAKHWARQQAGLIHIVDLDGASSGTPKNLEIVKQILKEVTVPIELGGGIRDTQTIRALLAAGVSRVVLGTRAAQDEGFLKETLEEFNEKVIVSIDAKDGQVMVQGWRESSDTILAMELALKLKKIGFRKVIYTDTSKDGTLKGPNIKDLKALIKETGLKVISSGGISSLEDLGKLKALEKTGVIGVIVGKALYEGKFTLAEALKAVQ